MPVPSQPIRIFDRLVIVTDPVTGEVRHEGARLRTHGLIAS